MDLSADHPVLKKLREKQEKARAARVPGPALPVCSVRRQRAPFPRSWSRLLVSVPSQTAALIVLKRLGLCKDIRYLIVWNYLGRFAFHWETNTLVQERIGLAREFAEKERQRLLMQCVEFETRMLKFETGNAVIEHSKSIKRGHLRSRRSSRPPKHCLHRGVWARVHFPPESASLVYWSKHVLE